MSAFESFPSWSALVGAVARGERIFYHAPLDARPVLVRCELRGRNPRTFKVRVFPPSRDADPFTADTGHLDRFKRLVKSEPDLVLTLDDE